MTAKKPLNRRLLFSAAWARAKFLAAWLCEPVVRHIGDALREAWDIARNGVGDRFEAPVETAIPDVTIATHVASAAAPANPAALIRAVSDAYSAARIGIQVDHIWAQGLRMVPQPFQQQQACAAAARPIIEPTAPAHPPHLSDAVDVDHGAYVSEILAELMDEEPPRPEPTVMETVVSRAFTDGLMLGRQMAIAELEARFAEFIATLRMSQ